MNPWITTAWLAIGTLLLALMLRETANGRGLAHEADRSRTWFFAVTLSAILGWPAFAVLVAVKALLAKPAK